MTTTLWLVAIFMFILAYALYEVLVWTVMDMTMDPKLRRPWTIRRWIGGG